MLNNQYQLYVDDTIKLCETLVLKFESTALAINNSVMMNNGVSSVDTLDESTWKYYQNISGVYHFSDEPMTISSLDVSAVIPFTKQSLAVNKTTRAAYEYGTRFYRDLILRYPNQEMLIIGILYPCDINEAISAKDGTILSYVGNLVEKNEVQLIPKLQEWIYSYLYRWVIQSFSLSDDLYAATFIGQLHMLSLKKVFSLRLEACKTNQAHSFHVKQYLASHGYLDAYIRQMTLFQSLFFYRNILYIRKHSGQKDTFGWLVDNVMTHRNLALYEYSMAHNLQNLSRVDTSVSQPLLPEVAFRRTAVNPPAEEVQQIDYTLEKMFDRVEPLAAGNSNFRKYNETLVEEKFQYSPSATVATKLLESSVIDYTDAVPYTLQSIRLNHWIDLVASGEYQATVLVDIKNDGLSVRLSAQEALVLYMYALSQAFEPEVPPVGYLPLLRVPKLTAARVVRHPIPNISELLNGVNKVYLTNAEVSEIYATAVSIGNIVSIEDFNDKCLEIFEASRLQYAIYSSKENPRARAQAQFAVARLHKDSTVRLPAFIDSGNPLLGRLFSEWITEVGFDFTGYTKQNFYDLALSVVITATGANINKGQSLASIQKAMVAIFSQLSSYSIQLISEINEANIVVAPNPGIRVSDSNRVPSSHNYVKTAQTKPLNSDTEQNAKNKVNLNSLLPHVSHTSMQNAINRLPTVVGAFAEKHKVIYSPAKVRIGSKVYAGNSFAQMAALLTDEQKRVLPDFYCTRLNVIPSLGVSIELPALIPVGNTAVINGFTYASGVINGPNFTYSGVGGGSSFGFYYIGSP